MNSKILIDWYRQNKRDLPWRQTISPYLVWLSEIILQQTRVAQGLPYYLKFIEHFPSINDLANASEQEVLNLWQGLGYYSRARNLHFTAKDIVANYQGIFPENYQDLCKLKGVGAYTAAAIASFCYNEPVSVLDGNVYRVLARLFGIDTPINSTEGQKYFKQLAQKLIDKQAPGMYNQAIMEFGALHCTPNNPKCDNCPFAKNCIAYQTGKVGDLPVKLKKIKIKKRFLHYFLVKNGNFIILEKRISKDIWQNLYQLPLIEKPNSKTLKNDDFESFYANYDIKSVKNAQKSTKIVHKLTHQHLHIQFWIINTLQKPNNAIALNQLTNYPMPIVIANFLENSNL